ncbi:ZIP zinc transporter-domain-containing protein [Cantharellus anzutake]|uniref:ZIP zinc transporter-domain-containing protein n=1 Tax=Cantharellus anzutake TaxID=1750568 RepID=UPI00190670F7|nr:ZIP zinc transporter-domain-containing protein [Cantharellus anzutake]KAF8336470.1 ZIP zinc transporter-domain-containing protein [Cantharellus anzutake]
MPKLVDAEIDIQSPSLVFTVPVLFFVSLAAAYLPVASQRSTLFRVPKICFFLAKYFGTGVILSTALTHLLNDGFVKLGSVRWLGFKHWPGMIVLLSIIAIFLVDFCSDAYVRYLENRVLTAGLEDRERNTSEQSWFSSDSKARQDGTSTPGSSLTALEDTPLLESGSIPEVELIQQKGDVVGLLTLQIGVVMHSIVLGFTLGVATDAKFTSLLPAIIFHQIFEGFAVGTQLAAFAAPRTTRRRTGRNGERANVIQTADLSMDRSRSSTTSSTRLNSPSPIPQTRAQLLLPPILALFFAVPIPLTILIISSIPQLRPPTPSSISSFPISKMLESTLSSLSSASSRARTDVLQGITCAVSAGLLIFVALVELVAGQFRYDPELQRESLRKQFGAVAAFIAGCIGMGIIP